MFNYHFQDLIYQLHSDGLYLPNAKSGLPVQPTNFNYFGLTTVFKVR